MSLTTNGNRAVISIMTSALILCVMHYSATDYYADHTLLSGTGNAAVSRLMDKGSELISTSEKLLMLPVIKQTQVNCASVFRGNETELQKAKKLNMFELLTDQSFVELASECESFRKRGYLTVPVNEEERTFPLAFSIQIYKDLVQVEKLLRAIYRPQNIYCLNVDNTSVQEIHDGMRAISRCFDNIIVTNVDVEWGKFSQVEADLVCMQAMYDRSPTWKYLLSLTGQEYPLKTNLDLVKILMTQNGSQMIDASYNRRMTERWYYLQPPPINVTIIKGQCHFVLTRSFVRFVLYDSKAQAFADWAKRSKFPDETYFQTLGHSPHLGVPGAYTGVPEMGINGYQTIARYKIWKTTSKPCYGKYVRSVCVFGVHDLPDMANSRYLFVNKLYNQYQPMALRCLEERHYNWTRDDILGLSDRLDLNYYRSLSNVKHHVPSGLEDK